MRNLAIPLLLRSSSTLTFTIWNAYILGSSLWILYSRKPIIFDFWFYLPITQWVSWSLRFRDA
jgi:hypothetical protein